MAPNCDATSDSVRMRRGALGITFRTFRSARVWAFRGPLLLKMVILAYSRGQD
jgi:hypothetical protein